MVQILQNVGLNKHSTMRLGGPAAYLAETSNKQEVEELADWARDKRLPIITIGDGSNIVWTDAGFKGLVLVSRFKGFEVDGETVRVAAGENWDETVRRTLDAGLTGIEYLSLIPGTVGGTPVQNVGAYGQEIANVLEFVEAYDLQIRAWVKLAPEDCAFGYRTSRFKTTDHGRFIITRIAMKLKHGNPQPPFYESLQKYLDEHHITDFTPQVIRDAVISIRRSKLPDPAKTANTGSFFANPIISSADCDTLLQQYPALKFWRQKDGRVKLAAAWLVEQAGFRDKSDTETGMATWPNHALVLVNEHASSTADLLKYRQKIIDKVKSMFGVTLEQEPELLGD